MVASLRQLVGGMTIQEAKLEEAMRLRKNSAPGKRRHFGSLNVVVVLMSHRSISLLSPVHFKLPNT